jgi:hypothetical protein
MSDMPNLKTVKNQYRMRNVVAGQQWLIYWLIDWFYYIPLDPVHVWQPKDIEYVIHLPIYMNTKSQ